MSCSTVYRKDFTHYSLSVCLFSDSNFDVTENIGLEPTFLVVRINNVTDDGNYVPLSTDEFPHLWASTPTIPGGPSDRRCGRNITKSYVHKTKRSIGP